MDIYIFSAYYFDQTEKQIIKVNANSRFTAYCKANVLALQFSTNLDLIELEKVTYKF